MRKVKVLAIVLIGIISGSYAHAESLTHTVVNLARSNGYKPTRRVVQAIIKASQTYKISVNDLTAIAILETGIGRFDHIRHNDNGTYDVGLFQINTINHKKCRGYNLVSPEGSAMCAAKLLSDLRKTRGDYLGVYHSKTPSVKHVYISKLNQVVAKAILSKRTTKILLKNCEVRMDNVFQRSV